MTDILFDVRNALAVGNYHQAIADGSTARPLSTKPSDVATFNVEKTAVVALGQVGLGQGDAVVSQLRAEKNPLLVTIRTWAELMCARRDHGSFSEHATNATHHLQSDAENVASDSAFKAIFAASALLYQHDVIGALTLAKRWLGKMSSPNDALSRRYTVELHGIAVESLLRLNRPDEAVKEVKNMEQVDSEAIVTMLYSGIVSLHQAASDAHAAGYDTAVSAFKEVQLRCGQSVMVSNLMALAYMGLGDYDTAERFLLDALSIRTNDEVTLANLAVVSANKANTLDSVERYIQQAVALHGAWGEAYETKQRSLEEAISAFMLEE